MAMRIPTRFALKGGICTEGSALTCAAPQVTKLFQERLQAWKHACGYIEEYITATEKMQLNQAKEYEKVLKVRRLPGLCRRKRRIAYEFHSPRPDRVVAPEGSAPL